MDDGRIRLGAEHDAVFAATTTTLQPHLTHDPMLVMADLAAYARRAGLDDLGDDWYGDGGATTLLEDRVADVLGMPAAVFVPSGTMAQQIALRLWCEQTGDDRVGLHPTSHLLGHEDLAHEHLTGLRTVLVGEDDRVMTAADVRGAPEPFGALQIELPHRELGSRLPPFTEVEEMASWCADHHVPFHLDGARVWEAAVGYARPLPEVCAPFDSVYVSFYKALGAIAGAALAGPEDLIDEARTWVHRHGGLLVHAWPMTLGALRGLDEVLPQLPAWHAHAAGIAATLRDLEGVNLAPDPPHTNVVTVVIDRPPVTVAAGLLACATELRTTLARTAAPAQAGHARFELTVTGPLLDVDPARIAELVAYVREVATRT